jgi:hypothetical protein
MGEMGRGGALEELSESSRLADTLVNWNASSSDLERSSDSWWNGSLVTVGVDMDMVSLQEDEGD